MSELPVDAWEDTLYRLLQAAGDNPALCEVMRCSYMAGTSAERARSSALNGKSESAATARQMANVWITKVRLIMARGKKVAL